MPFYVKLETLLLALLVPFFAFVCIYIIQILIISVLSWKMKSGLKRLEAIYSQRTTQKSLTELDEVEGLEDEEVQPLTRESIHGEREVEYASLELPLALQRREQSYSENPEYATVFHNTEVSISVNMTANEAYRLIKLGEPI